MYTDFCSSLYRRSSSSRRQKENMTRHFGVATIYHRGCIYHPRRGCIYHRGGDFAIAVAMTRAMVISNNANSIALYTPRRSTASRG
jgi:hypothetical protein